MFIQTALGVSKAAERRIICGYIGHKKRYFLHLVLQKGLIHFELAAVTHGSVIIGIHITISKADNQKQKEGNNKYHYDFQKHCLGGYTHLHFFSFLPVLFHLVSSGLHLLRRQDFICANSKRIDISLSQNPHLFNVFWQKSTAGSHNINRKKCGLYAAKQTLPAVGCFYAVRNL